MTVILLSISFGTVLAQISPGDLTTFHANLEGMSNCTKCHALGNQIRNDECLACHTDIGLRQKSRRGFHGSADVLQKKCSECHSEHHGRNFRIVNFNPDGFNHSKTGFELVGKHAKLKCNECHKPDFIADSKTKSRKNTYLGLNTACVSCHVDQHQGTLGTNCQKCHTNDSFKPASKFDHKTAKFALTGAHQKVDCAKCHVMEQRNGKNFQKFTGLNFGNCTPCHQDFHKGKFGNNCTSCHVSESFKVIKNIDRFDHSKTNYPLLSKHLEVKCLDCHKGGLNVKPKYDKCISCHTDYHKGEFTKNNILTDCSECHTVENFSFTSYTIQRHSTTSFALTGSHLAIPCQSCHQKNDKWKFKIEGSKCLNCHKNVHGDSIERKIKSGQNCELCHSTEKWSAVTFNHELTGYKLLGMHLKQNCSKCHTSKNESAGIKIDFITNSECVTCHKDIHVGQFTENGIVNCRRCHNFDNWKPNLFDHSKTAFPLEGAHSGVPCYKCHKSVVDEKGRYVKYKFGEVKCALCHS